MVETEPLVPPAADLVAPDDVPRSDAPHGAGPGVPAALALSLASAALTACGGGEGGAPSDSGYRHASATSDADAARFLQQAQFASTREDIAALRGTSYAAWLQQQLGRPRGQTGWDWLEARGYGADDANTYCFSSYPADFMVWQQLLGGEDPVRRRMALALSEFFVVSTTQVSMTWISHAMAHWWDILVGHAFGNFRDLLEAVSLSPAMGVFLNTRGNQKENNKGRVPDENYAREVMQLFTIGLYQLNADGSVKTDGAGRALESYAQEDVTNLARVFTGYVFDADPNFTSRSGHSIPPRSYARRPMRLDASKHSMLEVRFLGTTIAAGTPGPQALRLALDTLFNHPNVGPFFGRQMIQRLVTSNPSPAYVARVAAAFNNNGAGVRGDLRAVWAAVLLDDEARDPARLGDSMHGKLREPLLRFIQWARTFGAVSAAGSWKIFDLSDAANRLGQSALRAPSVFNFFRPGYVPPSTGLADQRAVAPEFQLVNESSVGGYLNFMQGVIQNGIHCPRPSVPEAAYTDYQYDVKARYSAELARVTDPVALIDHLNLVLCAGQLPVSQRSLMVDALKAMVYEQPTSMTEEARRYDRVAAAVLMVMASSAYLVQK